MAKIPNRPPARVPDLNAPRFRKSNYSVIDDNFISDFLQEHPEYSDMPELSKKGFIKKKINQFNSYIWKHVLNNRDGIDLPERLGVVFVGAKTSIYNPVKYGLSASVGKEVRTTNPETNGLIAKVFYSRHSRNHGITVKTMWGFKICREFARSVASVFKTSYNKFRRVENKRQLMILFEQRTKRKTSGSAYIPNDYNEFE